MKKHSMPEMKEGGVNVTPLIDIVMCLIIFYMLVAKIGVANGVDPAVKTPPKSVIGGDIKDPGNVVTINIVKQGNGATYTALDPGLGTLEHYGDDRDNKPLINLLTKLKKNKPELKAVIRADGDTPYSAISPALFACALANVKEYNLEATKGDPNAVK